MSEFSGSGPSREINPDEAERFIAATRRFLPYLTPVDEADDQPVEYEDGSSVQASAVEAHFRGDDALVSVNRIEINYKSTGGDVSRAVTWQALVEEAAQAPHEEDEEVIFKQRSYAASEDDRFAPVYEEEFLMFNRVTNEAWRLRPRDYEDFLAESRAAGSDEEKFMIVADYANRMNLKKKELEALTGISESDDFTPERLDEIMAVLARIDPEADLIPPDFPADS